ncbi:MAG: hypothetical protein IPH36_20240 [Saprospiraceae bacterium]|nr:hypothetical protein [Saprospiraceae bacterium]
MDTYPVRAVLEGTCDKAGSYTYAPHTTGQPNGSWTNEMGCGRVNANRAIAAALYQMTPTWMVIHAAFRRDC